MKSIYQLTLSLHVGVFILWFFEPDAYNHPGFFLVDFNHPVIYLKELFELLLTNEVLVERKNTTQEATNINENYLEVVVRMKNSKSFFI